MPKHLILAAVAFSTLPAFAATTKTPPKRTDRELVMSPAELKSSAVTEATSAVATPQTRASDAQVSDGTSTGILKLEDPGLADRSSNWRMNAGVRVQTVKPGGTEVMNNGQAIDLGEVGSAVLPVISLGVQRLVVRNDNATWGVGLAAEAGYTSQETHITYPSGAVPRGTRLSTGTVAGVVNASARFEKISSLEWQLGWVEGLVTSSHSAPDNAVNFSRQGHFRGPRAGVSYWPNALVAIDLLGESLSSDLETQTDSGNLSLGARVTW